MIETNIREGFEQLSRSADELELSTCVKEIVRALGAESYVFVSLHPSDVSPERTTHRYLIGCFPAWCQIYNENKWYLIDPCLEHARRSTVPLLRSEMYVTTQGQRALLEVAGEHGFRSGLSVPAHGSEEGRIGMLYVGSEEDIAIAEPRMKHNCFLFHALAMTLLAWSSRRLKEQVVEKHSLTEDDLRVVRYVRDGFNAGDIASEFGVSSATVYSLYRAINRKIGVPNISAAVKFANTNDLLC
jgi:DNA-binding CsgD family transcriptional regulator